MTRLLAAILCCALMGPASAAAQKPSPAPNAGFIYAKLTWPNGDSKVGFLRWEAEEAFWDDGFHSRQRDLPWLEFADVDELRAERRQRFYAKRGLFDRIMYSLTEDDKDPMRWRIFLCRIGDLDSIEVRKGEHDFAVTADGSRHEVGGYANDAGSDLLLYCGEEKPIEIEWNDLKTIEFLPAPPDAVPYAERLYGTLESTEGSWMGYIQWDKTECLSIDVLDGEDPEGTDHEIPMGQIVSIARRDKHSAEVELKDGRTLVLSGTNDVDDGNRGIMVELDDVGRISVPWKRFEMLTFAPAPGSGRGRGSYEGARPLRGTVTRTEGAPLSGRLVFDLDKAWAWNVFSGACDDLDYDIPLPLIRTIERLEPESCRVTLASGLVLGLSGSMETGLKNAGMLVFAEGAEKPDYVPWRLVDTVSLGWGQ